MNSDEILEMQAGHRLNVLVTEKVMGFQHFVGNEVPSEHYCLSARGEQEVWLTDKERYCKWCGDMPMFSEKISAAWEILEKVKPNYYEIEVSYIEKNIVCNLWIDDITLVSSAEGKTAPEAICKAVLIACK